jgi:hypothetical protein
MLYSRAAPHDIAAEASGRCGRPFAKGGVRSKGTNMFFSSSTALWAIVNAMTKAGNYHRPIDRHLDHYTVDIFEPAEQTWTRYWNRRQFCVFRRP